MARRSACHPNSCRVLVWGHACHRFATLGPRGTAKFFLSYSYPPYVPFFLELLEMSTLCIQIAQNCEYDKLKGIINTPQKQRRAWGVSSARARAIEWARIVSGK